MRARDGRAPSSACACGPVRTACRRARATAAASLPPPGSQGLQLGPQRPRAWRARPPRPPAAPWPRSRRCQLLLGALDLRSEARRAWRRACGSPPRGRRQPTAGSRRRRPGSRSLRRHPVRRSPVRAELEAAEPSQMGDRVAVALGAQLRRQDRRRLDIGRVAPGADRLDRLDRALHLSLRGRVERCPRKHRRRGLRADPTTLGCIRRSPRSRTGSAGARA